MTFDRDKLQTQVADLAKSGVYLGTSSWKYAGWCDQLYSTQRYVYRGKFAKTRFERNCLAEYSEVFRTVGVDAAYYDFPRREYLEGLSDQVPDDFRFAFKITDTITVKKFPNIVRFGAKAGQPNKDYLNPDLFATAFLLPCEYIRPKVGVLMFEFSKFWQQDYAHGRDFIADLDAFLGKLPKGWPYAIELRNKHWLREEYFACLAQHGVAHVYNSWSDTASIPEQMAMPNSQPNPDLVAARFLLRPGRKYEEAVKLFQPYSETKDVYEEAREAGARLILERKRRGPKSKTFLLINNRLEGSALLTIMAMIEILARAQAAADSPKPSSGQLEFPSAP